LIFILELLNVGLKVLTYLTDLAYMLKTKFSSNAALLFGQIGHFPPFNLFYLKFIFFIIVFKMNAIITSLSLLLTSILADIYYIRLIKNVYLDLQVSFNFITDNERKGMLVSLGEYLISITTGSTQAILFYIFSQGVDKTQKRSVCVMARNGSQAGGPKKTNKRSIST
jgi:NADH:ubiquinone oxidoreductase subunit 2 (subunit N)